MYNDALSQSPVSALAKKKKLVQHRAHGQPCFSEAKRHVDVFIQTSRASRKAAMHAVDFVYIAISDMDASPCTQGEGVSEGHNYMSYTEHKLIYL